MISKKSYPMFLVPFEVAASPAFSAEEKLAAGALYTWLGSGRPATVGRLASYVGFHPRVFTHVLENLANKGLLTYKLRENGRIWYEFLSPEWIDDGIEHLACGPVEVRDDGPRRATGRGR